MFRFSMLHRASSRAALTSLLALTACGGDKSDPGGARDSDSTGSSATTTTSSTGSGGASSSTTGAGGEVGNCIPTAPPNEKISDFAVWDDGAWGDPATDLTGGTFDYKGDGSEIMYAVEDEALHITGTVNNYVGLGMWFGPCTDASEYAGISFTIGGTIGDMGQAVLQVQQTGNKEVEQGTRGDCDISVDDCTYNQAVYDVPETPETVSVCFADMSGGSPEAEVNSGELYALQYQFNCETDAMCALDVTIDDITWTSSCP